MKKTILLILCIVLLVSSIGFAKPNVPSDSIPYLIITTSEAKSAYQVLADWKTRKGTPALVQTISYIMTNYSGIDTSEKIRKYIKDMYDSVYTRWILLGGDVSKLPTRQVRVGYGSFNAISDYYYSCLDGNWNYDEDAIWGELEDSVDLNPEVYVGRIPTNNPDTVSYFINKLMSYEKDSPCNDYQTKALFLTSWIVGERSAQSLRDTLATYLPPSFTKVYLNDYSAGEGMDSLNSGYGLIINYSMSQWEKNFITYWNTMDNINNDSLDNLNNQNRYGVMLNSTCLNNKFDLDCISKHFILNPNGGLVGYMGTAAYDVPRITTGFHTEIFNQIFNQGETRIGKVLTDSKVPYIDQTTNFGVFRRESMAYLLLGDPQMEIWTDTPEELIVFRPPGLEKGPQSFCVRVQDSEDWVPNAKVCLMQDDYVYEIQYTLETPDSSKGKACFVVEFDSSGWATVVASKKNYIPEERTILIGKPNAPSNLTAEPWSCHSIVLEWVDNSSNEEGFKIERKIKIEDWSQIATVGSNTETYDDTTVNPPIDYYYRVLAYNDLGNSDYSNEDTASPPDCPPGCPYVYVWNGEGFVNDNVILTGSEDEHNDKFSLTDYYLLSQSIESIDGKCDLEIREFENEVTRIDNARLFSVEYPLDKNIGVTPEGKVWIYSDPASPISCIDQSGVDHLIEIVARDKNYFSSKKDGYLIVNFGKLNNPGLPKPSGQMGSGGGGGIDPPPKQPQKLAPPGTESNANIVYIDVIGENGDWTNIAKVYPRTTPVQTLVELSQYVNPNEDFKIKISWDQAYSADHIAYYKFDDGNLTITELELISATHSEKGDINTLLNTSDNQRVELSPDETIRLSFSALPEDTSKQRGFFFIAKGYYEKLETQSDQPADMAKIHIPIMDQNYPNPFNLSTEIRFSIPNATKVTLNIYNILGQKVKTLVDEEKSSGTYTIFWDGTDKGGAEVASGIYFYQLRAGDFKKLKKMLLIK